MKLTRLLIKNFRGARYIEVVPVKPLTKIAAQNAEGKTSALDGLTALLGGARAHGKQPVTVGEEQSDLLAEFDGGCKAGGITVKKVIESGGKYRLEVFDKSGQVDKQQTFLDMLVGKGLMLDVEAYLRMEPDKRLEITRKLVNLDFRDIDARIKELDRERADAGRDVHGRKTQLDAMPEYKDAPAEEVTPRIVHAEQRQVELIDLAPLYAELERANATMRNREDAQRRANELEAEEHECHVQIGRANAEIAKWQAFIQKQQAAMAKAAEAVEAAIADVQAIEPIPVEPIKQSIADAQRANAEAAAVVGRKNEEARAAAKAANDKAIADANAANEKVRANRAKADAAKMFEEAREEYKRLDDEIAALDKKKQAMLRKAKFPIKGLGFGETDITYNGVPLAECSSAERIRVTTAMAVALAPPGNSIKCPLIRNGSLLDDKSLAIIEQVITDADAQAFVEIVMRNEDDRQGADVVIVEGKSDQIGGAK